VYDFKRKDSEIERAGYVMKMSDSIIISWLLLKNGRFKNDEKNKSKYDWIKWYRGEKPFLCFV